MEFYKMIVSLIRPFFPIRDRLFTKMGIFLFWFLFLIIETLVAQTTVFQNLENGYRTFRIPAMIKLPGGQLLAFCEGRTTGAGDFGNIDIVLKTSKDGGKSWSALKVLVNNDSLQAGNPAPVLDRFDPNFPMGRIFLFYNTGNNHEGEVRKGKGLRECWFICSVDEGRTWSAPVNITSQVHRPFFPSINNSYQFTEDWRSYANTPGHALQLSVGKYKGRLFVPANHSAGDPRNDFTDYAAHGYYSDDHGKTFHLSETVAMPGSNESIAVELPMGGLLMSTRNQKGDIRKRIIARSKDGGQHWDSVYFDTSLNDPVCQASMIGMISKKQWIIFHCNNKSQTRRDRLTLKISYDLAKIWSASILIDADSANRKNDYTAYSDLVILSTKRVGVLYEKDNYSKIVFKAVSWR